MYILIPAVRKTSDMQIAAAAIEMLPNGFRGSLIFDFTPGGGSTMGVLFSTVLFGIVVAILNAHQVSDCQLEIEEEEEVEKGKKRGEVASLDMPRDAVLQRESLILIKEKADSEKEDGKRKSGIIG